MAGLFVIFMLWWTRAEKDRDPLVISAQAGSLTKPGPGGAASKFGNYGDGLTSLFVPLGSGVHPTLHYGELRITHAYLSFYEFVDPRSSALHSERRQPGDTVN